MANYGISSMNGLNPCADGMARIDRIQANLEAMHELAARCKAAGSYTAKDTAEMQRLLAENERLALATIRRGDAALAPKGAEEVVDRETLAELVEAAFEIDERIAMLRRERGALDGEIKVRAKAERERLAQARVEIEERVEIRQATERADALLEAQHGPYSDEGDSAQALTPEEAAEREAAAAIGRGM